MIALLSDTTHSVVTGLAVRDLRTGKIVSGLSQSYVTFARLSPEEMDRYIETNDWEGVAGAYKIQGIAALFIKKIEGSWSGIMGLSLSDFYDMLAQLGFL
jgi:septum formation protein